MSLIKVALVNQPIGQDAIHEALGKLGPINGYFAQKHHKDMLAAGEKVNETKHKIANLTDAEKAAGHPAKLEAELKEHTRKVQYHSQRLRNYTHPGSESGQATLTRLAPPTKASNLANAVEHTPASAEHGVGGLISKAKDYAMKNPGKVGLGAAAVGAAAYGVHKMNQNNQQRY